MTIGYGDNSDNFLHDEDYMLMFVSLDAKVDIIYNEGNVMPSIFLNIPSSIDFSINEASLRGIPDAQAITQLAAAAASPSTKARPENISPGKKGPFNIPIKNDCVMCLKTEDMAILNE